MTALNRTLEALSTLLPAGALGISMALASATSEAQAASSQNISKPASGNGVSARLQAIRNGVSAVTSQAAAKAVKNPNLLQVWWGNGGWGRWHGGWGGWHGGWGNGGWRNGGWGNGGWGNGGWHNGGWPNFWHNW
jgi:rSAM-associated Gly-rich repeat protein